MSNTPKELQDWVAAAALLRQLFDEDGDDFLEAAEKLGIKERKAYYLIEVDKALEGLPISRARKLRIGWTKLQIVGPFLTHENYDQLLAQAEVHAVHELRDIVAGNWSEASKHCVLLYFFDEDYEVFAKVIRAHGATPHSRGYHGKEEALIAALTKLLPDETDQTDT